MCPWRSAKGFNDDTRQSGKRRGLVLRQTLPKLVLVRHQSLGMNSSNTVLVVGSAGRIGQAVVAELQRRKIPVRGFDIVKTPGVDDCIVGDITQGQDLKRAVNGIGTLIHLAA